MNTQARVAETSDLALDLLLMTLYILPDLYNSC